MSEGLFDRIFVASLSMLPLLGACHLLVYALVRRRAGTAVLAALLIAFLFLFFRPVAELLPRLGVDSFREGANFDIREAAFYVRALGYTGLQTKMMELWLGVFVAYAVIAGAIALFLRKRASPRALRIANLGAIALLLVPPSIYSIVRGVMAFREANKELAQVEANLSDSLTTVTAVPDRNNDLAVILYIGESTTRVNWSLYGYPRDTTPALRQLEKEGDLIRFDNVSSTHAHTAPSIIEALSIRAPGRANDEITEIYGQRRISLVDVLAKAGISTTLFSNQGRFGTWNLASPILFRRADRQVYSTDRLLGNADYLDDDRPLDHEFLDRFWGDIHSGRTGRSRFLAFHSYAGHANYVDYIPPAYREPVDDFFAGQSGRSIMGAAETWAGPRLIEGYDSATRYVSDNIARSIRETDRMAQPAVFVYFSDHGESPLTGQTHDSARYTWTMGAVPFLIHFNPAARARYPDLAAKYERLALQARPTSLRKLPNLVLDLMGVRVRTMNGSLHDVSRCKFASEGCELPYGMVRKLVKGSMGAVRSPQASSMPPLAADDITDRTTALYNLINGAMRGRESPQICFHRTHSLASILEARAIASCVEMEVVVENDRITLRHPPDPAIGQTLTKALDALGNRPATVWLDAKNADDPGGCERLRRFLAARGQGNVRFFVEIPSSSATRLPKLASCLRAMRPLAVGLSFYVPEMGAECSAARDRRASTSCHKLEKALSAVARSGLFTDISFDFRAYPAIRASGAARELKWNSRYVEDEEIPKLPADRFRLVIPRRTGPNFH